MPRRLLRTSLLNKTHLVKHNRTPNSEAFVFESEPMKESVSPNTPNLMGSTEKKDSKKVRRKKLIRYTQDLNVLMTDGTDSDVSSKTKSKPKRTKKARLPSFLPPIALLDENKKPLESGSNSTDSDNKENEKRDAERLERVTRRSRRKRKIAPVKEDFIQSVSTKSSIVDTAAAENNKARPSLSGSTTDTDEKIIPAKDEDISETKSRRSTRKKNSHMKKDHGQLNDNSKENQLQDNTIDTTSKPTLRREGTFEISLDNARTRRKTHDRSSSRLNGIDLTESTAKITPSPRKLRRTFDKSPIDNKTVSLESGPSSPDNKIDRLSAVKKMNCNTIKFSSDSRQSSFELSSVKENKISTDAKSSFEISFNFKKETKQEQVLDHLNITRRDSRTSGKKSSTGMQYSGDMDENKGNFITLRRQCRSFNDFEAANSFNDSPFGELNTLRRSKTSAKLNKGVDGKDDVLLAEESLVEQLSPRKGILKSGDCTTNSRKNTTFEVTDSSNEALEKPERRSIVKKLEITEATPNKSQQVGAYRDIFDVVIDTPTIDLRDMLIDNFDSFALANSFANQTNMMSIPKLSRTNTFTIDDEGPKTTAVGGRRSTRKRWSQVEKSPVFGNKPPCSTKDCKPDANQSISKSVRFGSSPSILSFAAQSPMEERKSKAKKSVKIESPLKTPKMRLHSPLAMRKTPKPNFSARDNSILAKNCAYSSPTPLSSPASSSTPFPKKKEVSLLNEVLTNEKNKAEKFIKSSSRVKMPNFRKIHERQFEKMESIKDLQERKAARAQFLMSGCKVPFTENISAGEGKESRKKLSFSPLKTDDLKKKEKKTPKTALPKIIKPEFKKRASLEKKKHALKSKLPVLLTNLNSFKAGQLQTISQQSGIMKNISKPQQHLLHKKVSLERKITERKPETKLLSRFGFKQGIKVTKESQIKAAATKSKPTVNRTEENRKHMSAFRTNRRFELLMQFREKN